MTADEREREKLCDLLQSMALDMDRVDMEVAELLWGVAARVADGGSMAGLTQRAYWRARPSWPRLLDAVSLRAVLVRRNGLHVR